MNIHQQMFGLQLQAIQAKAKAIVREIAEMDSLPTQPGRRLQTIREHVNDIGFYLAVAERNFRDGTRPGEGK